MSSNPLNHGFFDSATLRTFGFRNVGAGCLVSKNCTITNPSNVDLGDHVRIDDFVVIACTTGTLRVGNRVHIGAGCYLGCAGGISIFDFGGLSQGVKIYSASDDYSGKSLTNPTVPKGFQNIKAAPVLIDRHTIIGAGSIVLPGVTLSEGVAVGALSLVNKSLDAWTIYFGSPVKRLRSRSKDLLRLESELIELERNSPPISLDQISQSS